MGLMGLPKWLKIPATEVTESWEKVGQEENVSPQSTWFGPQWQNINYFPKLLNSHFFVQGWNKATGHKIAGGVGVGTFRKTVGKLRKT